LTNLPGSRFGDALVFCISQINHKVVCAIGNGSCVYAVEIKKEEEVGKKQSHILEWVR
jgi:hypothetical protein